MQRRLAFASIMSPRMSTVICDLSILIVNWNTRDLLGKCLQSVEKGVLALNPDKVDTFVVDNASIDGSADMVRECFPWVTVVENRQNVGFVRANNQVLRKAASRYLLLLNSDAVLPEGALRDLVETMERHPHAGAAGPVLLNRDHSFQASYGRFPTFGSCLVNLLGLSRRIYGPYYPSAGPEEVEVKVVDWVGGACMLVRREAIRDVGALDENIVMYAEEMDWCRRMRDANWQVIFCPGVSVVHYGGGSSAGTRQWVLARQWQSTLYFIAKHHGKYQARFLRACVSVIGLLRAGVFWSASLLDRSSREEWREKVRANLSLAKLETNYDG